MPAELERVKRALADQYDVEREIGAGGMATVYLAHDWKHGRDVAIKVLHPDLAAAVGCERFLHEIKLTAQLNHPHILSLIDSGEADGLLYYVMPYIEGESLRDRINRERQLSIDEALKIAGEVADALEHAHGKGIIHRDIKPENILLSDRHAILADFGIAHGVTEAGGERLTATGIAVGTVEYMSPEQAVGERNIDARSDLYALGCVLYEMLVGEPPFQGTSAQAVMARHAVDQVPPIRTVRPSVPVDLENIVAKALDKVPADRFQTAEQFVRALSGEIKVTPTGTRPVAVEPGSRSWGRVSAAMAVTVVVIAGAIWMTRQSDGSAAADVDPFRLAVFPFDVQSSDPDHDYLASGVMNLLGILLESAGEISVVDQITLRGALAGADPLAIGPDSASSIAIRVQAGRYLFGSLLNVGGKLSIRASLFRPNDTNPPEQISVERPEEAIDSLVTDLAVQILGYMGAGGEGRLANLGEMPTANFRALKAYLQGLDHLHFGRYDSALVALEKAVDEDPGMTDAWFMLSFAYEWNDPGDPQGMAAREAAFAHLSRSTRRYRELIEAWHAMDTGDAERAERLALDATARNPDRAEAWYLLFTARELYRWRNPEWGSAIPALREAHRLHPWNPIYLWNYVWLLRNDRQWALVDSLYRVAHDAGREILYPEIQSAFDALVSGERHRQDSVKNALEVQPYIALWVMGFLFMASDSMPLARTLSISMADNPNVPRAYRATGFYVAALAEIALGRWADAQAHFASEARLEPGVIVQPVRNVTLGVPLFRYAFMAATPYLNVPRSELVAIRDSLSRRAPIRVPSTAKGHSPDLMPAMRTYLIGLLDARLGEAEAAIEKAVQLESLRPSSDSIGLLPDLALEIRALVAVEGGHLANAVTLLDQQRMLGSRDQNPIGMEAVRPFGRLLRADVLFELGRREEALGWYGGFPYLMSTSPIVEGAHLSHIYGRMGQIYDEMGDTKNAIDYYTRFVTRWQDADPQFQPRVDSARARLRTLQ